MPSGLRDQALTRNHTLLITLNSVIYIWLLKGSVIKHLKILANFSCIPQIPSYRALSNLNFYFLPGWRLGARVKDGPRIALMYVGGYIETWIY